MKEYCTQNNGDCSTCSLVNYGYDCRNNKVEPGTGNVKNINPAFGDPITFRTVAEMEKAIRQCGYELPEDGLREGRDFELI